MHTGCTLKTTGRYLVATPLLRVQADEIRVKAVGGVFWLASATLEVRSRLWLGSVIGQHRDGRSIGGLLIRVRRCGPVEKILLVTDGLSSYKSQALKAFGEALHTGKVGRPRLVLGTGVMIAGVMKRYRRRRVVEVMRRVVAGSEAEVISRVIATQRSLLALIDAAYIERLQATFRARLAPLVRRTRAGAHEHCTLEAGMWLVGSCYDLLWVHRSLGEERTPGASPRRVQGCVRACCPAGSG